MVSAWQEGKETGGTEEIATATGTDDSSTTLEEVTEETKIKTKIKATRIKVDETEEEQAQGNHRPLLSNVLIVVATTMFLNVPL